VLWLERPPFARWIAAALLLAGATWSEFSPPSSARVTFLAEDVAAGTPLTAAMVDTRLVPTPGFSTVEPSGVAAADLIAGDPLTGPPIAETVIPEGWLLIRPPHPRLPVAVTKATGVILAGTEGGAPIEFPALVVEAGVTDAFTSESGSLAVPPEWLAQAAAAAGEGRLIVGVEATAR